MAEHPSGPAKPQAGPETAPANPVAPPKPEKLPVPPAEEREKVARQLGEIYGLSKDRAPEEQRTLAKELAALAEKSARPAERYVLLQTAAGLACQAGDVADMLRTVDRLAAAFEVDALAEKATMIKTLAAGAKTSAAVAALLSASDPVIDEALAGQKYDLALELADEAYKACAQSAGREHRKRAFDRRKQVQALAASWREVQAMLDKLKTAPDDPAANLAAGRYYCFEHGDWNQGLTHLAKSSDADLKKLAQQEIQSPPGDAAAMVKLADAWWALSESAQGPERDALMLRAGTWYREAQPDLASTLLKAKLDKRLEAITRLGRPIPEPTLHGPPPPAVAPFDAAQAKRHQERWAKYLGVPVEKTNSIGMKLVLIPPGEFLMGSTEEEVARLVAQSGPKPPEHHLDRLRSEKPRHRVRIPRPFYLGECEVTQEQYERVMGKNPAQFKGDTTCPVERVGWADVQEFLRRLDGLAQEKAAAAAYRLPTEAEWEYACRAGTAGACYWGDAPDGLDQCAWTGRTSKLRTHPVGKKRPNAWGLFDTCGNVWELCADWSAADYYAGSPADDPRGPESGTERIMRDGCWWDARPDFFRSAYRAHSAPNRNWDGAIGFRAACEIPARPAVGASPAPRPGNEKGGE